MDDLNLEANRGMGGEGGSVRLMSVCVYRRVPADGDANTKGILLNPRGSEER